MRCAAFVALVVVVGCSHKASDKAPVAGLQAASADEVVATVDGRPIYASDVARQARARGTSAKEALSDLVDAEVLAGEAQRRKLDHDLEVVDETKGAMVRRYLHETFEPSVHPSDVPDQIVRREYQRNLPNLNHDTYADVWHFVVSIRPDAPKDQLAAARQRAIELGKKARGMTVDQFKELAKSEGLRNEEIITARDGWVQRPFSEAAFTQLKKPGDVTYDPPQTTFGFHVEYLIRWIPPAHITLSEAAPKIREKLFPEMQKRFFAKFVDEAMSRYHIVTHPEHLPK
jgi:peptidyl-prolyl cis-trans isomerase C